MKKCVCLFSSYPQLTNKDQVSWTNERSSCLTAFENVVVTYCEIKHHFAMHSILFAKLFKCACNYMYICRTYQINPLPEHKNVYTWHLLYSHFEVLDCFCNTCTVFNCIYQSFFSLYKGTIYMIIWYNTCQRVENVLPVIHAEFSQPHLYRKPYQD